MTSDLSAVPSPLARVEIHDGAALVVGASPRFRAMLGDRPSGRLGVSEGTFVGWVRQALADGELSVDARLDGGAVRLLFARESERAALLALEPQPNTRFRDIVEESPDIIAVIDRELRHVFVNRAITAATGMSPADFEGKTHADLGMPEELVRYFQGVYRKVFETGQEGAKDFSFQTPSGETREYSSRVVPLREPDGRIEVLLSYARDSTERNRAQADRLALERKLQETQRLESLGLLAGGIAHDFNNLLTTILGTASLVRVASGVTGDVHLALGQIEQAAMRAADLCLQMLAYAGLRQRHEEPVAIGPLVRDVVDLVGASGSKNATIEVHVAPDLPWAHADRSQVQQVVMNFVLNGLEALPAGAGSLRVDVRAVDAADVDWSEAVVVPTDATGALVEIVVRDDGAGMDAATLARVFDPFFTTKFAGRGLGLAATLGIVRGHGGGLAVQSAPGEGTTFTVWLRAAAPRPAEERVTADAAPPSRVLLVDDEDSVRNVTSMLLISAGHSVTACGGGAEALERFEEARPDLVLLDLTMPGIDGLETLERLRQRGVTTPVVLMSGYGEERLQGLLARDPATRFLQKPFSYEDLQGLLHEMLVG